MTFWASNWEIVLVVLIICGSCTAQQVIVGRESIECVQSGGTWYARNGCGSADYCERGSK